MKWFGIFAELIVQYGKIIFVPLTYFRPAVRLYGNRSFDLHTAQKNEVSH